MSHFDKRNYVTHNVISCIIPRKMLTKTKRNVGRIHKIHRTLFSQQTLNLKQKNIK